MLLIKRKTTTEPNHQDQTGALTFRKFLQIKQLKNRQKRMQKQYNLQLKNQMKSNNIDRIKILPPKLMESIACYDSYFFIEQHHRKSSTHQVSKRMHSQDVSNKQYRIHNVKQKMDNWRRSYRRDQLNSMRFSINQDKNNDFADNKRDYQKNPRNIRLSLPTKMKKRDLKKQLFKDNQYLTPQKMNF